MTPHKKNALTWCISMCHVIGLNQTRGINNVTLKTAKNSWVSRSTGKSNIQFKDSLIDTEKKTYKKDAK